MKKVVQMRKVFSFVFLLVSMVACVPNSTPPFAVITPTIQTLSIIPTASMTPQPSPTFDPEDRYLAQTLPSPNGEFIAELYFSRQVPEIQAIEILDYKRTLLWQVSYQTDQSLPHSSIRIYKWSADSSSLYFYYSFSPDGGDHAFWWEGFDLQRIAVTNGNIESVIRSEGFVSFAFSPDENQMAYAREEDKPSVIFIRDLATGIEASAEIVFPDTNYVRVGDIRWAPNSMELIFQTETEEQIVQTIYLNTQTMEQKVIREYKFFTLQLDGWTADGKIRFIELGKPPTIIEVDVHTDETVVIGTPTPHP